ncbi:penicillin-binding protein 2 [Candidatus Giovannonibacteria bacterium]|nr:penicillin-binding protein 2 [Candidatus Giovannonibacteria bacterium]
MHSANPADREITKRIRITFAFLIFFAGILILRLFFLQVVSGAYYKTQAQRQQNFSQVLTPRRGNIYLQERSGELIPLASTKEGYSIYINPKKLIDADDAYAKLSKIIPLDKNDFLSHASKKNDPYEVVARKVERDDAEKVRALKIENVGLVPEEWRVYPSKTIAAHVVGFLGYKDDELEGRYGIERYFEDALKGRSGLASGSRSAGGIILELGRRFFSPPEEGNDIILTIEPNVQSFFERKFKEIQEEWKPSGGGGIIIEPKTGKIVAMTAFPNFDPNTYGESPSLNVFINPIVESVFEFGSVFKPLTIAAGVDKKVITPDSTYFDPGRIVIDGYTIRNFDDKSRGETSMQKVLEESLNTGAAFVAGKIGKEDMRKYFLAYGLGEKTGITLPGEVKGNVSNLYSKRDVEHATASFGQGISATPLEFARAAASLANGGKIMQPYIVDRIERPGRSDIVFGPKEERRVISGETSETISRMLSKVADDALLGGRVKFEHWTAAAKTGTAQISLENGKGYSEDYLHSFLGWAPAFDSRFLLFMYIERPQGVKYASQSLTPYYAEIMQFLLTYYEVPPDR